MKRSMQPFESHMQYIPQWMCDYNLYGCDYMDCSKVMFRSPVPNSEDFEDPSYQWHDQSIPHSHVSDELQFSHQSHCEVEVDVCVHEILNRCDIKKRYIHHDFVEHTTNYHYNDKLVQSMACLWRDETRRRRMRMGLKDTKSSPFPPDVLVSLSADLRNTQAGGWVHEEEFRNQIAALARYEKETLSEETHNFETFLHPHPLETYVKTSFESIEDLHPANFPPQPLSFGSMRPVQLAENGIEPDDIEVDESRIFPMLDEEQHTDQEEDTADGRSSFPHEQQGTPTKRSDPLSQAYQTPRKAFKNSSQEIRTPQSSNERAVDPTGLSISQSSSAALQGLGIRDAGDFSHVDDDAFEVPAEFIEALVSVTSKKGKAKRVSEANVSPTKRRRLISNAKPDNFPLMVLENSIRESEVNKALSAGKTGVASTQPQVDNQQNALNTALWSSVKNRSSQDQQLTFPVVKDPRAPSSVQKMSQQNHLAGKTDSLRPSDDGMIEKTKSTMFREPGLSQRASKLTMVPLRPDLKLKSVSKAFAVAPSNPLMYLAKRPPTISEKAQLERDYGIPTIIYQDAYYSNEHDVPERPREWAGKEFKLASNTVLFLPDFDALCVTTDTWSPIPDTEDPPPSDSDQETADQQIPDQQNSDQEITDKDLIYQ